MFRTGAVPGTLIATVILREQRCISRGHRRSMAGVSIACSQRTSAVQRVRGRRREIPHHGFPLPRGGGAQTSFRLTEPDKVVSRRSVRPRSKQRSPSVHGKQETPRPGPAPHAN